MADTIENLRVKMRKPEEINEDCIVDILCSISETEIEINQSEKEFLKNKLNDSREENNSLTNIINNQDREIARIKKENEQNKLNEIHI